MKNNIEELIKENYADFVKSIVSIENKIDDLDILDNIYEKYKKNEFKLLNDNFEEVKAQNEEKEQNYYDCNIIKENFMKELKEYNMGGKEIEEFFDYTFDIDKVNNEIVKKGKTEVIKNMISAYLHSDSICEELKEEITYSEVALKFKDIVKDNIVKLSESQKLSYLEFRNNEEFKNDLGKDNKEMISVDKEKEIRKKIREHEEWINSKGTRGKQLNLENENLSGMMLLNMDLRNANLKNADITQCVIFADLRGANLEGAKIDNTKWTGSNISKMTIDDNKLNLIEYHLEQEGCKHTEARKSLKTNRKDVELER